jgi:GGDEF domain-containing protein
MVPKSELSQSTPLQKLPAPPGLAEIHQFLALALDQPGKSVEIRWNSRDLMSRFVLTITCPMRGKDIKWVLQGGQEDHLESLWNYTSCDVLLVYNLIACASELDDGILKQDSGAARGKSFGASGPATGERKTGAEQKPTGEQPLASTDGLLPHETSAEISGRYSIFAETTELSGDFYMVPASSVLRSVIAGRLTGMFQVQGGGQQVNVYFKKGQAVFTEGGKVIGDECVIDLLSWREGRYLFKHRAQTEKKNIDTPTEKLVEKGIQLNRLSDILKHMGFTGDAVPRKKSQNVGMAALSATRPPGSPFSVDELCKLYEEIDNRSTVGQIAKRCHMGRSVWAPVMSHLLDSGVITFTNEQPRTKETPNPELVGKVIDTSLIHSVIMALRRADTGMFTYPAFLYFIEQEYFRCYRTGSALSLVVMDLRVEGDAASPGKGTLEVPAMAEVFRRVSKVKRGIDIVAHYEQHDFGIILPNTAHAGAYTFAKRVYQELTAAPLPGIEVGRMSLAMGIASIPRDCGELNRLMAAAEAAKSSAQKRGTSIALYESD